MQNLDQIRAAKALEDKDKTSRQAASKLPPMILENGLLGALAFALEVKDSRREMRAACSSLASHLANPELRIGLPNGVKTPAALQSHLSNQETSAFDLQRITTESLAFLGFLKRYAPKKDEVTDSEN